MIVEMRTYTVKPGTAATVADRFAQALPGRVKHSPLAAFWTTEIGPLNQVIHVWPYESMGERDRIRAEAVKAGGWPPDIKEFVVDMETKILLPTPFSPALEPRELGKIYEIRSYIYRPGAIPGVIKAWQESIGARTKLSPLVGCWYTEVGPLNQWVHVWAYKDLDERLRIRGEAVKQGIWPPKSPEGMLLKQENAIAIPAAFSPLR